MTLDALQIQNLRENPGDVVVLGTHHKIVQSMLDYDFLIGRTRPSVVAIISRGRKQERYFYGEREIEVGLYADANELPATMRHSVKRVLSVQSGRSAVKSVKQVLTELPEVKLVSIFAEQVPENHALELAAFARERGVLVVGPASVGVLVPASFKLGAIGGIEHKNIRAAGVIAAGGVAVISTSGGMVNELIHTVTAAGLGVSLALALGGDRFPITTPLQACLIAQNDPHTQRIVYFGELGGHDEYAIAQAVRARRLTKPVFAYVAGIVAELFEAPPQFGHAKALADSPAETAPAKKQALRAAGVTVVDSFNELFGLLAGQAPPADTRSPQAIGDPIGPRSHRLLASHISGDKNGNAQLLGDDLLATIKRHSLAGLTLSMLLGKPVTSLRLIGFTDFVLRLLADHGPYVSGAANTIITARAGKDLVSSLSAGLLTIGPRFGGAINQAAASWLCGIQNQTDAKTFVESFRSNGGIIPGIGHKKYRLEMPDPRVQELLNFAPANGRYTHFALAVQNITTGKKSNLILNVDGAVAAILLDLFEQDLHYSFGRLQELVDIEFFNALFVLGRSIGLTAHYLDQRRHDEGLLRFSDQEVSYLPEY